MKGRWFISSRAIGARAARIGVGVLLGMVLLLGVGWFLMISMPGESREPPLPALTDGEVASRDAMKADLEVLAGRIGERNYRSRKELDAATVFIEERLKAAGHTSSRHTFTVSGVEFANVEAKIEGTSPEVFVLGAHYDTALYSPGANDNGTGVVALLDLARRLHGTKPEHEIRFVFFANEEPPYFGTDDMGSVRYANMLAESGVKVAGMLSLETMGYFVDTEGSQPYPPVFRWFYPDTGDFIAFIGNTNHRGFVRDAVGAFREVATVPSEGSAPPENVPGVGWSDHASFWSHGWPAAMVTDTAVYRYPHYHTGEDTPDKVDYERLARVVAGLEHVVRGLAKVR